MSGGEVTRYLLSSMEAISLREMQPERRGSMGKAEKDRERKREGGMGHAHVNDCEWLNGSDPKGY